MIVGDQAGEYQNAKSKQGQHGPEGARIDDGPATENSNDDDKTDHRVVYRRSTQTNHSEDPADQFPADEEDRVASSSAEQRESAQGQDQTDRQRFAVL